jgi:hypothetical protein
MESHGVDPETLAARFTYFEQRLDERFKILNSSVNHVHTKLDQVNKDIRRLDNDIRDDYISRREFGEFRVTTITQSEFWPVKVIVYGLAGSILMGFLGLLLITIGWRGLH